MTMQIIGRNNDMELLFYVIIKRYKKILQLVKRVVLHRFEFIVIV